MLCVPFNWTFDGFRFLSVNIIWLPSLGFAFICLSCSRFSIFVTCSCSNVTAVSGLACLTSTAVSSANVSILLLVVDTSAVYSVYNIGPETLPREIPVLMSFASEYTSFIFSTKVLLLWYDLSKWWICSGKYFLIVCKRLSWFTPRSSRALFLQLVFLLETVSRNVDDFVPCMEYFLDTRMIKYSNNDLRNISRTAKDSDKLLSTGRLVRKIILRSEKGQPSWDQKENR